MVHRKGSLCSGHSHPCFHALVSRSPASTSRMNSLATLRVASAGSTLGGCGMFSLIPNTTGTAIGDCENCVVPWCSCCCC